MAGWFINYLNQSKRLVALTVTRSSPLMHTSYLQLRGNRSYQSHVSYSMESADSRSEFYKCSERDEPTIPHGNSTQGKSTNH